MLDIKGNAYTFVKLVLIHHTESLRKKKKKTK